MTSTVSSVYSIFVYFVFIPRTTFFPFFYRLLYIFYQFYGQNYWERRSREGRLVIFLLLDKYSLQRFRARWKRGWRLATGVGVVSCGKAVKPGLKMTGNPRENPTMKRMKLYNACSDFYRFFFSLCSSLSRSRRLIYPLFTFLLRQRKTLKFKLFSFLCKSSINTSSSFSLLYIMLSFLFYH